MIVVICVGRGHECSQSREALRSQPSFWFSLANPQRFGYKNSHGRESLIQFHARSIQWSFLDSGTALPFTLNICTDKNNRVHVSTERIIHEKENRRKKISKRSFFFGLLLSSSPSVNFLVASKNKKEKRIQSTLSLAPRETYTSTCALYKYVRRVFVDTEQVIVGRM